MDLIVAVVGAVATGIVGYFVGRGQAKQQVFYESQAKALTELRVGLLPLAEAFESWASRAAGAASDPSGRPGPETVSGILKRGDEIAVELAALTGSFHAHKPYVGTRARGVFCSITERMGRAVSEILVAIRIRESSADLIAANYGEGEPNYYDTALQRATRDAWLWTTRDNPDSLHVKLQEFDREVERAVGNRPGWRKWFGE